jgi:cation diffusion facilitator CzcD-associated flavoprotein CzcO
MALDLGRRQLAQAVRQAGRQGGDLPPVVIVGAGLSGLAMGAQLVRAGFDRFTIVEQADEVGGTWRDNTYPGAGCDVPSHLYSFSFWPKRDWSRRYAGQPEILAYARAFAERFGLRDHLRVSTTVVRADLDEDRGTWNVDVLGPDGTPGTLEASVVVFACGQLNRPHVPRLEGLERFSGRWWHSARWDHSVDVTGKRVAVVGSGASAIQFVPPLARQAASVTVFQRTPSYVAPKRDHPYEGLKRQVLAGVPAAGRALRWWTYWVMEARWLAFREGSWLGRRMAALFASQLRANVVSESLPEHAVVPDYPIGCKRILISNEWYPTLLRPNVTVVDEPIVRVDPGGPVTASGVHHDADVIVFGTGFETTDFLGHVPVVGRGGRTLAETWSGGAHAYLGVAVPDFPNCFLLYGPNTNLGHNSILFMVERQVNLVLQAVATLVRRRPGAPAGPGTTIEVGEGPDARDDDRVQRLMAHTAWVAACHSWYKDASGRVTNNWPTWTFRYWLDTVMLRRGDWLVTSTSGPAGSGTAGSGTAGSGTDLPSPPDRRRRDPREVRRHLGPGTSSR